MQLRPMTLADIAFIPDIDATADLVEYLHVESVQEGLGARFVIEPRRLREKRSVSPAMTDDQLFDIKQVVSGTEEGLAIVAEHEQQLVGLLVAKRIEAEQLVELLTLRVDYDMRRQGIATAGLFQVMNYAKNIEARAIRAHITTDNTPGCALLAKLGFTLSGLDTRRTTNHDLVKEQATLIWHLPLDNA
jgi:RimJ/RimL family protein N-acetyltransferase